MFDNKDEMSDINLNSSLDDRGITDSGDDEFDKIFSNLNIEHCYGNERNMFSTDKFFDP